VRLIPGKKTACLQRVGDIALSKTGKQLLLLASASNDLQDENGRAR
jgi:hypothetical protein